MAPTMQVSCLPLGKRLRPRARARPGALLLGKARAYEIERHPYEARAEHEPTRPDRIKVERTLQHPQRRDVGLDAEPAQTAGRAFYRPSKLGGAFCFARPQLAASSIPRPLPRLSLCDLRDQLFDDDVPE
jgi:hypothetical protein